MELEQHIPEEELEDAELHEDGELGEIVENHEPTDEDRARAMGWRPEAEYRGRMPWKDAAAFLAEGEAQLPVLRDRTRVLSDKVSRYERDIAELRGRSDDQSKALKDMVDLVRRSEQKGYDRAVAELRSKQREAVNVADAETYDALQRRIDEIERERHVTVDMPTVAEPKPPAPERDPVTTAWIEANPWFGLNQTLNQAMVAAHIGIKQLYPSLSLEAQYERAKAQVVAAYPAHFPEERMSEEPPRQQSQQPRPRLRTGTLTPSSPVAPPRRNASPFDQIEDPAERAEGKEAFERLQRQGVDMTAEEYVALFVNPKADIIQLRQRRKV